MAPGESGRLRAAFQLRHVILHVHLVGQVGVKGESDFIAQRAGNVEFGSGTDELHAFAGDLFEIGDDLSEYGVTSGQCVKVKGAPAQRDN